MSNLLATVQTPLADTTNGIVVPPKRNRGRPKLTIEQKAANKRKREEKKALAASTAAASTAAAPNTDIGTPNTSTATTAADNTSTATTAADIDTGNDAPSLPTTKKRKSKKLTAEEKEANKRQRKFEKMIRKDDELKRIKKLNVESIKNQECVQLPPTPPERKYAIEVSDDMKPAFSIGRQSTTTSWLNAPTRQNICMLSTSVEKKQRTTWIMLTWRRITND
mmetsp:Transcript_27674/g.42118  ORF Transcript_27674/g.42118 Transcript_27674/m.42118 type:complete len:222 (+) Transcript_27674:323-988(+)